MGLMDDGLMPVERAGAPPVQVAGASSPSLQPPASARFVVPEGLPDNVDRGRLAPSPPTQTGRAVLRHPAFQSVARDELAQALDSGFRKSRTSRAGLRPAHLDSRRSTIGLKSVSQRGFPRHPCAKPCGTARTLAGRMANRARYHIPAPLRSTVITRFFATTRALTPAGPFATGRGSLIHVTRTSEHSISNHLRTSASRVPLPLRWQPYFVGGFAGAMPARQFRRPNRVHFVPCTGNRRYGLLVHVQLLSTRGYGPGAVTFNYWPFSVGQVRDSHPAVQVRFQAHIARRFNAGEARKRALVPKGRLRRVLVLNRPFGTEAKPAPATCGLHLSLAFPSYFNIVELTRRSLRPFRRHICCEEEAHVEKCKLKHAN